MVQDRRVRRTRAALHEALLSLTAERGYEGVTVQDLIDRADIGRSTFYAHYTDKADLLQDTLSQVRSMVEGTGQLPRPDRRRPLRFGLPILRHAHDQQRLLRALLARPGDGVVRAEIEQALALVVREELEALAEVSGPPRVPLDVVTSGVVATFLAVLVWWVGEGFEPDPEAVEAVFLTLAAPGVRAAIPPVPTSG